MKNRGCCMPITGVELESRLLDLIIEHKYDSDGKFLSDRDAMALFGASRTAVRNAINSLVEQGYLFRVGGKGTFVNEPFNDVLASTIVDPMFMRDRTGVVRTRTMMRKEVCKANKFVSEKLAIDVLDPVLRIDLAIEADKQPAFYTISYIPYDRFPKMEVADYSTNYIYKALKDYYGVTTKYWKHTIKATTAPIEVAEALGIAHSAPTLSMDSTGWGYMPESPEAEFPTEFCIYYLKANVAAFSCIQKCNMD